MFFGGIIRAIKHKNINSCIGIDGILRKAGMVLSMILFFMIDVILNLNFLAFLPDEFLEKSGINYCGIADIFGFLYITFESISILKNMYLCDLPIPRKIKNILEKILSSFTNEIES